MCISPITIKNPRYAPTNLGHKGLLINTNSSIEKSKNLTAYIQVPCGKCPQCVAYKQSNYIQRLLMEEVHNHLFYCTLTYNNKCLPTVVTSLGYKLHYPDIKHLQNMFKRLRKSNQIGRPFRYVAVSEYGGLRGRPHFHCIIIVPKEKTDKYIDILNLTDVVCNAIKTEWRENIGSKRSPIYRPLCDYVTKVVRGRVKSTFDFQYIDTSIRENATANVANYVVKYLVKGMKGGNVSHEVKLLRKIELTYEPEEARDLISKCRCRLLKSKDFGALNYSDVYDEIRKGIESSYTDDVPQFVFNGKTQPLCRYYRNKLVTAEDCLKSAQAHSSFGSAFQWGLRLDSNASHHVNYNAVDSAIQKTNKIIKQIESNSELSEIFNY